MGYITVCVSRTQLQSHSTSSYVEVCAYALHIDDSYPTVHQTSSAFRSTSVLYWQLVLVSVVRS